MRKEFAATIAAASFAVLSLSAAAAAERAQARLLDRQGQEVGMATLNEGPHGLLIQIELRGLPPGPKGIHIHSVGTCADAAAGFVAAKGHLHGAEGKHGLMNPEGPEAGDLPNLFVHQDGTGRAEMFTSLASLSGAGGRGHMLDQDGAALVIHENPDDHLSQPIGGAGARIACGVIEPM